MKLKSYYFILAVAAIMFGCSNESVDNPEGLDNTTPDENGLVYVEFTAGAQGKLTKGNVSSRTQLGSDGTSVLWSPNDTISVFDIQHQGGTGTELTTYFNFKFSRVDDNSVNKSAKFGGKLYDDFATLAGLYPYNPDAKFSQVGHTYETQAYLNPVQNFPAGGGYDPNACLSVANIDVKGGSSEFKLAVGMIGFTFGDQQDLQGHKVKSIVVRIDDVNTDKALSGKVKISASSGDVGFIPTYSDAASVTGVLPDGEDVIGKTYYLCVAPVSDCNLNVSFILDDNSYYIRSIPVSSIATKTNGEILKAYSYSISNINLKYSDFTLSEITEINNISDFETWYEKLKTTTMMGRVVLKDDIVLNKNKSYESVVFNGIFEGNGYTISNLTVVPSSIPGSADTYGAGLFSELSGGTVQNLKLKDVTVDITSLGNSGKVYIGGIAGFSINSSVIDNCQLENDTIKGNSNNGSLTHIAGLMVGVADRLTMSGCSVINGKINKGAINESAGGLVGEFNAKNTLVGNYVYGESVIDEADNAGGIVGRAWYSGNKVVSCYSNIVLDADFGGKNVGTICGYIDVGDNVVVTESYYIGSDERFEENISGTKITRSELVNKLDALNTAIKNALPGTSLFYTTDGTSDATAPLIFGSSN